MRVRTPSSEVPRFCYTGGVTEQQNRPLVGVGVVFIRDGRVFLAQRRGSHGEATWASAGGHLEYGESLEDCARREAREELGVDVGELRVLCFSNIIAYDRHYVDVEFLGDIGDQEPVPNQADGAWKSAAGFPCESRRNRYLNPCAWPSPVCFPGIGTILQNRRISDASDMAGQ